MCAFGGVQKADNPGPHLHEFLAVGNAYQLEIEIVGQVRAIVRRSFVVDVGLGVRKSESEPIAIGNSRSRDIVHEDPDVIE